MKKIYTCLALALIFSLAMTATSFAQSNKKVTVILTKEYSSDMRDTAWFSYRTDLKDAEYKLSSVLYAHGSPAVFSMELTGTVGSLKVYTKGESSAAVSSTYVSAGDTVLVRIIGKGKQARARVVGDNFQKYELQGKMDSISMWGGYPFISSTYERGLPINLKTFYYRTAFVRDDKLKYLNEIKDRLSAGVYNLYKTDIEGQFLSNVAGTSLTFFETSGFQKRLLPVIKEIFESPLDTAEKDTRIYSREFLNGIRNRLKLEFTVKNQKVPTMVEQYNLLKNMLSGVWREAVLYDYISKIPSGSPEDFIACAEDALKIITDRGRRKKLSELVDARSAGARAYNFSLTDSQGKTVRLADFKGKAVLLDFWYTGCPGCLVLSKLMDEKVLPLYKGNKDFVYVTVNIDKDKNVWKGSIAEGKYTKREYVNLNTGILGDKHKVIDEYKVRAYPTLIVIDKQGKIISSNIKREGGVDIIKYINEALNKAR